MDFHSIYLQWLRKYTRRNITFYENINSFRPCFHIKWASKHRSKDQGSNSLHLYWSQSKEVPRNRNLPWAKQMFGQHQAAFREQRKVKRVYALQDMLLMKGAFKFALAA